NGGGSSRHQRALVAEVEVGIGALVGIPETVGPPERHDRVTRPALLTLRARWSFWADDRLTRRTLRADDRFAVTAGRPSRTGRTVGAVVPRRPWGSDAVLTWLARRTGHRLAVAPVAPVAPVFGVIPRRALVALY